VTAARWALVALLALTLGGALLLALVYRVQRGVLFPAAGYRAPEPDLGPSGAERIWLEHGAGRSEAFFLPAHPGRSGPAPLVVFAHGNGERIDDWLDAFEVPRGWGASVLLVEYPGYGRSSGSPSEPGIAATMVAAHDWALTRSSVDPARIVGWGRSLGAGAVCRLARERALAALVLESTFTSVRAMAQRLGLPAFLVRDPFENLDAVAAFEGPVLIVHGERDELVPVAHAHALYAAARRGTLHIEPGCGHNDCPRPWAPVREFLLANGLLAR
jgi:fermentation-respiration switch protein FrsA (DUF1100 family)